MGEHEWLACLNNRFSDGERGDRLKHQMELKTTNMATKRWTVASGNNHNVSSGVAAVSIVNELKLFGRSEYGNKNADSIIICKV